MYKILIVDKYAEETFEILEKEPEFEVTRKDSISREELLEIIGEYHALLVRSATKPDKEVLDKAVNLKIIIRGGEGTDNIDKAYAKEKGIVVENTPGQNSHAVAELALAHMFACARNLQKADATMQEGKWEKKKLKGIELKGKTVGIIGFGKIGKDLAGMCKAIGMNILYYKRHQLDKEEEIKLGVKYVTLEELFKNSDIVTIHVPLMPETKCLIGEKEIGMMKKSSYLINCARGGIVDEAAVARAVKEGKIKGAAFDVFTKEPPDETNPLIGVPDITLTPHLGASTKEAQINCGVAAARQLIAFFKENKIINRVN